MTVARRDPRMGRCLLVFQGPVDWTFNHDRPSARRTAYLSVSTKSSSRVTGLIVITGGRNRTILKT